MTSRPPTTLRAALARGPLPLASAVGLAVQLCDALTAAAAPHGDVRPETISLVDGGVRLTGPVGVRRPQYVAPECRRGWSTGGRPSDVYAVGVVLYEMLVGRPPAGRFAWPGQVDPAARWLDPILVRCLADEPVRRYRTTAALRADLLAGGRPRRRPPVLVAAVAGAGAIVGAGLVTGLMWVAVPPAAPQAAAVQPVVNPVPVGTAAPPSLPAPANGPETMAHLQQIISSHHAAAARMRSQVRGEVRGEAWPGPPFAADSSGAEETPLAGGTGGMPFRKTFGGVRPVRGVAYALGSWGGNGCLRRADPIYTVDPDGTTRWGGPTIVGRDGYVVAGMRVQVDETNVVAVAIDFCAWRDGRPVPGDGYTSGWVGFPDAGRPVQRLGDDGRTVVGLCGRQGLNLDAVGLVEAR